MNIPLEKIGFYTLSEARRRQVSGTSPIYRLELIITGSCNFKCPYCRGTENKTMTLQQVSDVIDQCNVFGLKNIRFSGGEPCLNPELPDMVNYAKFVGVERIAISTNGSMSLAYYENLIKMGVNDFSISLDAACCVTGDVMAGVKGKWEIVIENIKQLSKKTYVTVGIVFNETNVAETLDTIEFAKSLGVADIRPIPSAQYNQGMEQVTTVDGATPILKYRVDNQKVGVPIRGLDVTDTPTCTLVLDDLLVFNGEHYPCPIYFREKGQPIGKMSKNWREDRIKWSAAHNCIMDDICRTNCLDVCRQYNGSSVK